MNYAEGSIFEWLRLGWRVRKAIARFNYETLSALLILVCSNANSSAMHFAIEHCILSHPFDLHLATYIVVSVLVIKRQTKNKNLFATYSRCSVIIFYMFRWYFYTKIMRKNANNPQTPNTLPAFHNAIYTVLQ